MRSGSWSALGSAALAAFVLVTSVRPADAAAKRALPLSDVDQAAVERARAGAVRKLQEPECLRLLDDFTDGSGRLLRHNLEGFSVGAAEYAHMIVFASGTRHSRCGRGGVALVSSPGLPRVYVCGSFAMLQVREPQLAEDLVIHEILHTLGLGENPPSSVEITKTVQGRCR
jgi:hypothetical protein